MGLVEEVTPIEYQVWTVAPMLLWLTTTSSTDAATVAASVRGVVIARQVTTD